MLIAIIVIQFMVIGALSIYIKKRGDYEAAILAKKIETSEKLKRTLAMGLSYRFNYPTIKTDEGQVKFEKGSNLFLKQTPYEFEDFVANIFRKIFGGEIFVTSKSGDFGVDFEHFRDNKLYLGQVKVYRDDVGFEPIAILHSNMVKQGAKGGYIITTSDYTKAAKEYAGELNIELINGVNLVDYWIESMESNVYVLNPGFV